MRRTLRPDSLWLWWLPLAVAMGALTRLMVARGREGHLPGDDPAPTGDVMQCRTCRKSVEPRKAMQEDGGTRDVCPNDPTPKRASHRLLRLT